MSENKCCATCDRAVQLYVGDTPTVYRFCQLSGVIPHLSYEYCEDYIPKNKEEDLKMAEYIHRDELMRYLEPLTNTPAIVIKRYVENMPTVDIQNSQELQEKKYCRMIPLEPDLRNCTNVFICTNCHQHIHLGFIRKEYSGSFCLECGAKVKDCDNNAENNGSNHK